jgi:ribonuclease P protein component
VTGSYVVLFGRPGETAVSRLGITATRKCGDAVERNRLKRWVREIYRRSASKHLPAIDLVVNLKSVAVKTSFARLEADLLERLAELRRRIES